MAMPTIGPYTALRLGCYGLLAVILGAIALRIGRAPATDPCDAACQALGRATKHAREVADSARAHSVQAETVYVARRAVAHRVASELPEPKIVGQSLVIGEGVYDVPAPVAAFVMQQQGVIQAQASALDAADSLVARFRVERVATDALQAAHERERDALLEAVRRSRPGAVEQFVRRTLPVVAFVAGVYAGSRVVR